MDYLELVEKFISHELDIKDWIHSSHLIVAFYFIINFKGEATEKVRNGIKEFNESKGIINTDTSGYHETITIFWIKKVEEFIQIYSIKEFNNENAKKLMDSEYHDKLFPLKFYSKELLSSTKARKNWVEPDLLPL